MTPPNLTPIVSGDDANDLLDRAEFLRSAIAVLLVGSVVSLVFQRMETPGQTVRMVGPVLCILVSLAARFLLARGRHRSALRLMVMGMWVAVTVVVMVTNGIEAPMVVAFPLLILATGWLMGAGVVMWVTGLTVAVTIGMALAQMRGLLPVLALTPLPLRSGIQVIVYVISAVLVVFAMRGGQRRQDRLDLSHQALTQRTLDLEVSHSELNAAQAVSHVGSLVYEISSGSIAFSAESCRIFGLRGVSALSRQDYMSRIHADDRAAVTRAGEAARQGKRFDFECRVAVDGDVRWIRSRGEAQFAADGSPTRVLAVAQDISERKHSEAAVLAAKAEAERANQAKSKFLATVSHDLGQPLSAMALMVNVLQADTQGAPNRLLDNMQECVKGMSGLVGDLMEMSKLEAGVVKPFSSNFSLHEVLLETIAMQTAQADVKGLQLRLRATDAWTYTDRRLLQRVLGNLLSNAVRYTRRGGVLVACRVHAGKRWVEVWDTGIGIPHDKLEMVFQEFAQLHHDARVGGSGLGLSIVAKISQLLGLEVRLRSTLGKGSMFAIALPADLRRAPRAPQTLVGSGVRRLIGLVEDNTLLLDSLVFALERRGHQVVAGRSRKELLDLLGGRRPDIVVSDFHLSNGETGIDVIDTTRTLFGSQLPCVLITADTSAAMLGAMAYRRVPVVQKPFEIDAILAFVHDAIP